MDGLVFFVLFASISAQCVRDLDCHLNGECFRGKCVCDRGWQGEMCQMLHLKNGSVAYGYGTTTTPKTSCWGGGPPYLDSDGQYHLLVTEIAGHCGFGTSLVRVGCLEQLTPYTPVNVAVPTEAHNVYYAYSPNDEMHVIFHIGKGDNPSSCNPYFPCTNRTTPNCTGGESPPQNWTKGTCHPDMSCTIHYSKNLKGPWLPHPLDLPTPKDIGATNPAPLRLSNGTWLLMTRGANQRILPNGTEQHYQNILLFRAESWKGPWTLVNGTGKDGALNINYEGSKIQTEDPTFWKGKRGYHVLFHYNLIHAYSEDAINWYWSPNATAQLYLKNGVARDDHQRPRAIVDDHGILMAIMVASHPPVIQPGHQCTDATQLLYFETESIPVPPHWNSSMFEHLGVYGYHRNGSGENTPFRFKGKQYMMESIGAVIDGHETSCFQIRELGSGMVVSSVVNQSAHHAFFSATIDYEKQVVWVFGSAHDRSSRQGACDVNRTKCYIGVWSSKDLLNWTTGPPLFLGSFGTWYPLNVDVDFVRSQHSDSGLPKHQAIMYMETEPPYESSRYTFPHTFAINTGSDGDLSRNWVLLAVNYSVDQIYSSTYGFIANCPSIRYDAEQGYYYIIGGGVVIWGPARSKNLMDWEVSQYAPLTGPAHWLGRPLDNRVAPDIYTTEWEGENPTGARYLPFLKNMTLWNFGTSDVDLSTNDNESPTYINWISSTQGGPRGVPIDGTNYGTIGWYNGTVVEFFRHYF